jgi:hypothetical protein
MRDGVVVLAMAAAALVCCFAVSLAVAAGGTAALSLVGVGLPAAALIGIGGWTVWYVAHKR